MPKARSRAIRVHADFEGGRIEVRSADDPSDVRLAVPPDPKDTRFRQWFAFEVRGAAGVLCRFRIENAGACTWARGFSGYRVCATHDGARWLRVPTTFDGETLAFEDTPAGERAVYAYFAPYPSARLASLSRRAVAAGASRRIVARSHGGAPLSLLAFGPGDDAGDDVPNVWVIHQQHPGETMAGWFAEGLVERLIAASGGPARGRAKRNRGASRDATGESAEPHDDEVRALLASARVFVVPRMNPDGAAAGNHRTNAAGLDLNRQWAAPADEAPEVAGVRKAMLARGVDFFLDVHGDETIPHVFAQGTDGVAGRTRRTAALERRFAKELLKRTADFQTEHGYPEEAPGKANTTIAANWVGNAFGCPALTLEMPFSDHAEAPDAEAGWSPERSRRLGAVVAGALAACAPHLRRRARARRG